MDLKSGCHATLLHARLAILDLDPRSHQPFRKDDCILVFNGEIYNFRELRSELESLGHLFRTESDTEVVVSAYRQWGIDAARRFEGMWAMALYDQQTKEVWLSRDRFGEKPLHIWYVDGFFYFASEVKTLAAMAGHWPAIDTDQIRRYLVNGYKSLYKDGGSYFVGVSQIPAGTNRVMSGPTSAPAVPYYSLTYNPTPMKRSEAVDTTRSLLKNSVDLRLRADVPLAFCLSGGIDSTALVSLATELRKEPVNTFSIVDHDERYDESENIQSTVQTLGCSHTSIRTSRVDFWNRIETLVADHDSPVVTISYYIHSFLSEAIAEAGYKVAVSGTGADELFSGYYDHYGFWLASMQRSGADLGPLVDDWKGGYGKFVQNPVLRDPLVFCKKPNERSHIFANAGSFASLMREPFEEPFAETDYTSDTLRNRMLNELYHEAVPVILAEDDLNSMRVSIENRSPFLDSQLASFAYSLPTELLIDRGFSKSVLRDAIRGSAPTDVLDDKRKRGFNASVLSLVDVTSPDTRDRLLDDSPIYDLVDRSAIEFALNSDLSDNTMSKFLFSLISAKSFMDSQAQRSCEITASSLQSGLLH